MKRKICKLVSNAKQALFAFTLTVSWGTASSQTTYTFSYSGAVQSINLQPGAYDIEMWGANGESAVNQPTGGIGGYSAGTYVVTSPITLYVGVGGKGNLGPSTSAFASGGWNGGGQGYGSTVIGAGGGGASHVATATGDLPSLSGNQSAVLIVAGGGGGSGFAGFGGNGGGLTGGNGNSGTGGSTGGTFGQGANGTTGSTVGGGGGGWFGGNLGNPGNTGGSGGGSGYVGGVTSGTTAQTGQTGFVPNPDVSGNGLVLIRELCSITLTATGVNTSGICTGNSVTLTTNAVSNYSWSTGANTSSIVVTPGSTTLYSLTATSPSNCTASAALTITVNPIPVLSAVVSPTLLCVESTATIAAQGASTYTWDGGVNSGTLSVNPTVNTAYTFTGTSAAGCVGTGTVNVLVNTLTVTVPLSVSVCEGNPISVVASGGVSYLWSNGFPFNTLVATPLSSTSYTLNAIDPNNCPHTSVVNVTVNPNPLVTASADKDVICLGEPVTLTAGGATSYTWTNPSSTNGIVTVTPSIDLTYFYTVTGMNNAGCTGTATVSVDVERCSGLTATGGLPVTLDIFPNPNNGSFTIRSQNELSLEISNELGQIIKRVHTSNQAGNQVLIEGLSAGIYFVSTSDRSVNFKIIVSK
jgi:hypothetical protein